MQLSETLAHLDELKRKMDEYRPLDLKQARLLANQVKIEHVWSSNAIEGSTITLAETATILNSGLTVHGKPMSEHLATTDLGDAYDYMFELVNTKTPVSEIIIRDLNRLVLARQKPEEVTPGAYRVLDAWPRGSEDQPYVPPYDIRPAVQDLVKWVNKAVDQLHPVQYAADLHLKLVSIHPFADGNGRTSRLMMNFALTQAGYPVINIMPDKKARATYIDCLATGRSTGNFLPFEELVAGYAQQTLEKRISLLQLNEMNIEEANQQTFLKKKRFKPKR